MSDDLDYKQILEEMSLKAKSEIDIKLIDLFSARYKFLNLQLSGLQDDILKLKEDIDQEGKT